MVTTLKRTLDGLATCEVIPNCAFPVLPNSFPVQSNLLPCNTELTSLFILCRELARKPLKSRADSGGKMTKSAQKIQYSLIIPCIQCLAGQTEQGAEPAETGRGKGGIIGGNSRLRWEPASLTHGKAEEIRGETENTGRDGGWWRRRCPPNYTVIIMILNNLLNTKKVHTTKNTTPHSNLAHFCYLIACKIWRRMSNPSSSNSTRQ